MRTLAEEGLFDLWSREMVLSSAGARCQIEILGVFSHHFNAFFNSQRFCVSVGVLFVISRKIFYINCLKL